MSALTSRLLLAALVCGACVQRAPAVAAPQAPPPEQACGELLVPTHLTPLASPLPAVRIPAAGVGPAAVGFVGVTQGANVCIEVAQGLRIEVPAATVRILPFYTGVVGKPDPVLVTGLEASGVAEVAVHVDYDGAFAPEPNAGVVPASSLDWTPAAAPLLLGDLPLADVIVGRAPPGDASAELRRPLAVRGLTLPVGALIQVVSQPALSASRILHAAALPTGATVGGRSFPAGAVLQFAQGCDVAYPAGVEGVSTCFDVVEGRLVAP